MLPMLLPSGVSVDNTTMEEHQKREATWGRTPNDPFTGVPFTSTSQPLPNPQLKSRIDLFLLQQGMMSRDGMLGRQGDGENPQASRLIASEVHGQSQYSPCLSESTKNNTAIQYNAGTRNANRTTQIEVTGLGHSSDNGNHTYNSQPVTTESKSERGKKRDLSDVSKDSTEGLTAERHLLPHSKRPRHYAVSGEFNMFCKNEILKHFIVCCVDVHSFTILLQSPAAALMSSVCQPVWMRPCSPPCRADPPSPQTCLSRAGLFLTLNH